jgi:hypothetical protein
LEKLPTTRQNARQFKVADGKNIQLSDSPLAWSSPSSISSSSSSSACALIRRSLFDREDEILVSLEKLPTTRQNARQFKVADGKNIQLLTALVFSSSSDSPLAWSSPSSISSSSSSSACALIRRSLFDVQSCGWKKHPITHRTSLAACPDNFIRDTFAIKERCGAHGIVVESVGLVR